MNLNLWCKQKIKHVWSNHLEYFVVFCIIILLLPLFLSHSSFQSVFFLQAQGTNSGKPKQKVIISDCGEYVWSGKKKMCACSECVYV